jgi:LAO/AO transport system kinase
VVHVLDAFGFDVVLVETVGVGQTELDIMGLAHTTVVVLVPEAGDTIQVMKAGLLEIADVFVVNKADREGARRLKNELEMMLHLRPASAWSVPVLLTEATADRGIAELVEQVKAHGEARSAARDETSVARERVAEWTEILRDELAQRLDRALRHGALADVAARLERGQTDPYGAALEVLADEARLTALLRTGRGG